MKRLKDKVKVNNNNSSSSGGSGEESEKRSPVLLRVLVLPSLHSKDPGNESAEQKGGGIPYLRCARSYTHTKEKKEKLHETLSVLEMTAVKQS